MNIILSSDNNYARHAGVSITSIYDNNRNVSDLNVYLIDDGISDENHSKLDSVAQKFGRKITYIPFDEHKEKLRLNNKWEMPISAYARLFIAEMIPNEVEKILYLDCDTVVCDSLEELFTLDLNGKTIAAVEDVASCVFRDEVGIEKPFRYFCSGIVLIDLKRWREIDARAKMLEYLDCRNGVVTHHDQTILNGVFHDDCYMLHPRYDALTPTFIMSYENLKAYFKLWDRYYSKKEIRESVKNPAIIHYTSSNVGRPWENNKHPKAKVYQKYWMESPWKDEPWGTFKPSYDKVMTRTYRLYQRVPVGVIKLVSNVKHRGAR